MRAAIGIDVDSLAHYAAIHGLTEPLDEDPIYALGVPRFRALLDEVELPATFFLIGADAPRHAAVFAGLRASGSEIASHSFAHDYRLSRRSRAEIEADLDRAEQALAPLNEGPLAGFRAPGYNLSPTLLEAVAARYRYDSSMLPSPLYFAARAAIIRAYALAGRRSASLTGDPRQYAGPLAPYRARIDAPWRRAEAGGILELPMACEPLTRAPIIGTSYLSAPRALQAALRARLRKLPCINFELHAIDLLDASDHPTLRALSAHQRDLAVPAAQKARDLRALFEFLAREREVLTLEGLARATMAA